MLIHMGLVGGFIGMRGAVIARDQRFLRVAWWRSPSIFLARVPSSLEYWKTPGVSDLATARNHRPHDTPACHFKAGIISAG